MASILTNIGAMSALQTLRNVSADLSNTHSQISSGLRVKQASDNAAYWSIGTTMRSDNKALSAVQDALGLGAATVDTAYTGMAAVEDLISQMKSKVVVATEPGVDQYKVQSEIEQLKQQITSVVDSSSFSGVNWLSPDATVVPTDTTSIVASASRDNRGNYSIEHMDIDLTGTVLFNSDGNGILERSPFDVEEEERHYGGFADLTTPVDSIYFGDPFTLYDGDEFQFDIHHGSDTYTATISKSTLFYMPDWDGFVDHDRFWNLMAAGSSAAGIGIAGQSFGDRQTAWKAGTSDQVLFSNFRVTSVATPPEYSIMDVDVTTEGDFGALLSRVDGWLEKTIDAAANLGAISSRISMQTEFVSKLSDSVEKGIGRLVDADLNEASTRLKALQTQEQLATQSLSIANSNSESVLSLFR